MFRWAGWIVGLALLLPAQAEADCGSSCIDQLCLPISRDSEAWALVEAEPDGQDRWRVTQVHGGPLAYGFESGEVITGGVPYPPGRVLLVMTPQGIEGALLIDERDRVHCADEDAEASLAATIEAAHAPYCYSAATDAGLLGKMDCDDEYRGCTAAGSGLPGLGVLAVLLGLGAVRRHRARAPSAG